MTRSLPPAARRVLELGAATYPEWIEIPSGVRVQGHVLVPPSKSVSHRYLNLAMLAREAMQVKRLLLAEDTALFLGALEGMGYRVSVERRNKGLDVELEPPNAPPSGVTDIFCGNAGTFFRFAVASLAAVPGVFRVDGTARLRQRPVGALVDALRQLGADIDYLGDRGFAPLRVAGESLVGGRAQLDASESSQYLSAILMAGTRARRTIELEVTALSSAPYVDITLRALSVFGARRIERPSETHYRVEAGLDPPSLATVEGDYSAAAYAAAAAVLTGGRVVLEGLDQDSAQGDRRLLDLLGRFGGRLEWQQDGSLVVQGSAGTPLEPLGVVDMGDIPDQVPTVAALACFARGRTEIVGVPHLRIKESDRLAAMASQLHKVGAAIHERGDDLVIDGSEAWALKPLAVESEGRIDTFNDHRIAMSLALVGLRRPGVSISSPEVVSKSYPDFFDDLESLIDASSSSPSRSRNASETPESST